MTSATSSSCTIAGSAPRFTKEGARKRHRTGLVPPSETRPTPSSPLELSTEYHTSPGGTVSPSMTSLK